MNLWIKIIRHPHLYALQVTLTRCGIWLTIGPFTLTIRNESRQVKRKAKIEFSAGFGLIFRWLFMELGKTSFDIKDGKLLTEQMY